MRGYTQRLVRTIALVGAATGIVAQACTIFVLTDGKNALFFNNEDWSNPNTRVWFIPAGDTYHGCAYVGFDDGWAQGGLNTKGLAFDWVAGGSNRVSFTPEMRPVRGNACQRMLETCSTVGEATAFFRRTQESGFAIARILVADSSGASAIIGACDGQLIVQPSTHSRGFGYGQAILEKALADQPEASLASGRTILRACVQSGQYPTRYSNAYDLRSGDIYFFFGASSAETLRLNLNRELAKGPHFYDLSQLPAQIAGPIRPLLPNMRRFPFDELTEIPDAEPVLTARLRHLILDACKGIIRSNDFAPELWQTINPGQMSAELKPFGEFQSLVLVERTQAQGTPSYLYRLRFSKGQILQRYRFDSEQRLAGGQTEAVEMAGPAQ